MQIENGKKNGRVACVGCRCVKRWIKLIFHLPTPTNPTTNCHGMPAAKGIESLLMSQSAAMQNDKQGWASSLHPRLHFSQSFSLCLPLSFSTCMSLKSKMIWNQGHGHRRSLLGYSLKNCVTIHATWEPFAEFSSSFKSMRVLLNTIKCVGLSQNSELRCHFYHWKEILS